METVHTSIRRVRSAELRPDRPLIPKIEFPFYGIVEKVGNNSKSVLVARGDNGNKYWLNYGEGSGEYKLGEKYKFSITLSTYYSKDGLLRTDMWIVSSESITSDIELSKGFEPACMEVNITSAQRTTIPNLFLLTVIRLEDGQEKERYQMRYYDDKANGLLPDLGNATIKFEMYLSKQQIEDKGEVFTEIQTRTIVKEDGSELTTENPIYKPTLAIRDIVRHS